MYDTSINGSICQETKAGHEHADHGFISAVLCLTITQWDIFDILSLKEIVAASWSNAARSTSSGTRDVWLNICSLGLFCCKYWCVCDFPKPCCCDGFQTSLMHPSTWCYLNTRAKVWNWNGSLGTITTAQPQVKRRIRVCRCQHIQYITHWVSASCSINIIVGLHSSCKYICLIQSIYNMNLLLIDPGIRISLPEDYTSPEQGLRSFMHSRW